MKNWTLSQEKVTRCAGIPFADGFIDGCSCDGGDLKAVTSPAAKK